MSSLARLPPIWRPSAKRRSLDLRLELSVAVHVGSSAGAVDSLLQIHCRTHWVMQTSCAQLVLILRGLSQKADAAMDSDLLNEIRMGDDLLKSKLEARALHLR